MVNPPTNPPAEDFDAIPHVLIAEDDFINRKLAKNMIERLGYRCEAVSNGHQAVEAFRQNVYHIVFMDCHMPEIDGFETTARIRQWEEAEGKTRSPIIALTANAMKGDREHCLTSGMDDYMNKPVRKEILASILEKWLPKNAAKSDDKITPAQSKQNELTTLADCILDLSRIEEISDGVPEFGREILAGVIAMLPHKIELLNAAVNRADAKAAASVAHNLAGAASNIGALNFERTCREVLHHARRGDFDSLPPLMKRLTAEADNLKIVGDAFLQRPNH